MKDAHGVKFLGKMALATIACVALPIVIGALVFIAPYVNFFGTTGDTPEGNGSRSLPAAYHYAVTKAVLLKEDQWSEVAFPSTKDSSPLCGLVQIQEGRLLAAQSAGVPCAVAAGGWDRHLCGGRQQDVCAVVEVDPATYDDPEIHARIVRALSSPCDFFSPADSKRQQERIALGCDTGGTARRRVVIRAGARTDTLEFHAEQKRRR